MPKKNARKIKAAIRARANASRDPKELVDVHVRLMPATYERVRESAEKNLRTIPAELAVLLNSHPDLVTS